MAVRDGQPYVREAIESVLAQSFQDFEFIIVDDASQDGTPEILQEFQQRDSRVRVRRNPVSLGPYFSANRGLIEARGAFVARHDADDVSPPNRFEIQLAALRSRYGVVLVTGAIEAFGTGQRGSVNCPPVWQPRLEWELLFENVVGAGAHVMFPRIIGGRPVLFPARYRLAEDYGLWCSLSRLGYVVCPEQVVYRYRQHAGSISQTRKKEQDECCAALRRAYQSEYLPVTEEISELLTRFWARQGARVASIDVSALDSIFAELQSRFVRYVERRYGREDRKKLETALRKAHHERLAYWLYRSVRFADPTAVGQVLATAIRRRETITVLGRAAARGATAALAKVRIDVSHRARA
jgi:glycosyltransferase involved in cell wall biosynthesis